jgi:general secretion pathway protein D
MRVPGYEGGARRALRAMAIATSALAPSLGAQVPAPITPQDAAAQRVTPQGVAPQTRAERPQDSVTIRAVNVDLRTAVQLLGQYLDRPVLFSGQGGGGLVMLETPKPVPRSDVVRLLRGLLDSHNYELVDDTASRLYRARAKDAPRSQPGPAGLDSPRFPAGGADGTLQLSVIRLKHARASDVANTVNALYGRGSGLDRATRRPTLGDELRANQMMSAGSTAPPPPGVAGPQPTPSTFTGDVTIVPDTRANNLLIRANRADFALIEAAVKEIDVRPLQVLIEVLIAEVRRDRSLGLGVDLDVPKSKLRGRTDVQVGGAVGGAGGNGTPGLGEFVLNVMGVGGMNADGFLKFAAGRGNVAIVSRPVVLTANNEEAQIVIGSQRPFVQVSRSLPTDGGARDQVVQYKDVGTKLSVRPTISGDGIVQLEVTQEVSNATGETSFNAPVISTRSVQTHLLVQDGQTVALGGLADRQKDVSRSGIPVLSYLPVIGGLFGRTSYITSETELFVFLTPRVIRTDEEAKRLSNPLEERARRAKP